MNFFRIIILSLILIFSGQQILFADSHDTTKNIVDQAKEIILDCSGTHFDPNIVDAFIQSYDQIIKIAKQYQVL